LSTTGASTVDLLNNVEIVATSLIALAIFHEKISPPLWASIAVTILASIVLSLEEGAMTGFSPGVLLVIAACICWGVENNCTRKLSEKSSVQIVIVKGFGSPFPQLTDIFAAILLGFIAYGLSINCYILAQKTLAATKTSAYYSVAPFFSVAFSFLLLGERPDWRFYVGFVLMALATLIIVRDTIGAQHTHLHSHTHAHRAGEETIHSHDHADFPDHDHLERH